MPMSCGPVVIAGFGISGACGPVVVAGFGISGVSVATRVFFTTFPGVVADSAASLARRDSNSYQGKGSF